MISHGRLFFPIAIADGTITLASNREKIAEIGTDIPDGGEDVD